MTSPNKNGKSGDLQYISIMQEENQNQGNRMASVLSNALVVLFIFSSRFAMIFGWCDDDRFSRSCSSDQVCCGNQCVNGSSCLHQSCSTDFDCSVNEACCSGQCQYASDCLGNYCSNNSDCPDYESCCNNLCQYDHYCMYFDSSYNDPFLILFAVVGSLVAFFIVMMFIYYCNRRARLGRPGRVEMERQVTTTVPTTTQSVTNAPPQAHQQGHAYQSLPQCDQYQNAAPPPYSGRMATGSDLPPPYTPGTQIKPEEGHTSRPTYGAVQST